MPRRCADPLQHRCGRRSAHREGPTRFVAPVFGFVTFRIHSPFRFAWSARLSPTPTAARRHRTMGTPVTIRTAEYPRPDHFLLHISDTHLLAGGGALRPRRERAAPAHAVRRVRGIRGAARGDRLHRRPRRPRRGATPTTASARIVEPFAARLGARVIWVMGNHDDRAAFRARLLGEPPAATAPVDRVDELDGLRVITLDTTVPGPPPRRGRADAQLDWLAEELATPAPLGTILAMHHPPVPSVLDSRRASSCATSRGLAAVLARQRRPRDHRRPPALLDVRDVRRHPRVGRVVDLLRAGPHRAGRRHPRPRRRAGVQPRARLRRHRACTRSCRVDAPAHARATSTPTEAQRRLDWPDRHPASAPRLQVRRTDGSLPPTEPIPRLCAEPRRAPTAPRTGNSARGSR